MSKRCYSEYADHCWRFYARTPVFVASKAEEIDRLNWNACDAVYATLNSREKDAVLSVFRSNAKMKDAVSWTARMMKMSEGSVWRIVAKVEDKLAERRCL